MVTITGKQQNRRCLKFPVENPSLQQEKHMNRFSFALRVVFTLPIVGSIFFVSVDTLRDHVQACPLSPCLPESRTAGALALIYSQTRPTRL